jgi:hypothetical protein
LRRLGQGGSSVGTDTPGTTGRTSLDGMAGEYAIDTDERVPFYPPCGCVSLKDQTGCVPFGAAIVTRIRERLRYAWPS